MPDQQNQNLIQNQNSLETSIFQRDSEIADDTHIAIVSGSYLSIDGTTRTMTNSTVDKNHLDREL